MCHVGGEEGRTRHEVAAADGSRAYETPVGWRRFSTGWHPADLNRGDGYSHALSRARAQPLLFFVGDDVALADVLR